MAIQVRELERLVIDGMALVAAAVAKIGIGYPTDGLTAGYPASGALVPVMTTYPPRPVGAHVLRAPGQPPARKIRVLIELLSEYFEPDAESRGGLTAAGPGLSKMKFAAKAIAVRVAYDCPPLLLAPH